MHVALRSRRWLVWGRCPVAGPLNHGLVESFGIVSEIPEPVVVRSKYGVLGVSDSVDQRPDHINQGLFVCKHCVNAVFAGMCHIDAVLPHLSDNPLDHLHFRSVLASGAAIIVGGLAASRGAVDTGSARGLRVLEFGAASCACGWEFYGAADADGAFLASLSRGLLLPATFALIRVSFVTENDRASPHCTQDRVSLFVVEGRKISACPFGQPREGVLGVADLGRVAALLCGGLAFVAGVEIREELAPVFRDHASGYVRFVPDERGGVPRLQDAWQPESTDDQSRIRACF